MSQRVPTGSEVIDELLGGGLEKGILTAIYGPTGSGKTNLCALAAIRMAGQGMKIVYIDAETRFPVERFKQLTKYYGKALQNIISFRPKTFEEQNQVFEKLRKIVNKKTGLIIVDTIASLYRLELSRPDANQMLNKQLTILIALARKYNIPVLVTSQVYSDFNSGAVKIVGGLVIKNCSKCLVELKPIHGKLRRATLIKHQSLPERWVNFEINNKGLNKPTSP